MSDPLTAQLSGDLTDRSLLVDGVWTRGGGEVFEVRDPATDRVIATLSSTTDEQAEEAVRAADAAAAGWAATSPRERSVTLARAFALMTERAEESTLR